MEAAVPKLDEGRVRLRKKQDALVEQEEIEAQQEQQEQEAVYDKIALREEARKKKTAYKAKLALLKSQFK